MNKQDLLSAALVAIIAAAGTAVGTQYALAAPHAVNATPQPAPAAPASFAGLVERVAPAVVSVEVEQHSSTRAALQQQLPSLPFGPDDGPFGDLRRFFGPGIEPPAGSLHAAGSGFFISPDGYIATNNHVVENAAKVTIKTASGKELPARVIGRDPATDLAVLKVEGREFPYVSFEDRAAPRVGDWVVAVGNPFNLGGTATAGIVSALRRPNVSGSSYVDYLQIDAPINRGNSGGPTFDLNGRVVGVNSAIFSPSGGSVGIGFDIPADVAARVTQELIAHGKVTRGYIGATVQDITPEIAASLGIAPHRGALVAEVAPDGPSARAGVQSGDLVETVNGAAVASAADLTRDVARVAPGDSIRLGLRRNGRPVSVELRAALRPSEQQLAAADGVRPGGAERGLGLMVAPRPGGGLEIQSVDPASDAAAKGLQPGDVIRKIGSRPVNAAADVRAQLNAARASGRKDVLVLITHAGHDLYLPLKVPSERG